ncbi:hypothetical protein PR202_gb29953 [Eleusine coracana subsp. coracana]|uniref:Peroxisomal membrane protein PEX14 n=1 Tax=Eleusine coracana subsp. coracana TaxID=191504 RepID=A0AAV5G1H1_ELECO|nr:hypothetical protein PR202_gb29953 [Eleusine coracana subsp. coracana]
MLSFRVIFLGDAVAAVWPISNSASCALDGERSSESIDSSTTLQDTKEQEVREGKAILEPTELMREELVQSAVSFLKHPKVVTSSDIQRRSFLESKGLSIDEINEAFRRLQGHLIILVGIIRWKLKSAQSVWMDQSCFIERVEPETEVVAPVLPRHPKSYMEIMEMIQRGERPDDDIQDINDDPPNPDQPISKPRMAPKPKFLAKTAMGKQQDQEDCTGDSNIQVIPAEIRSPKRPTSLRESASGPNQEDSLLLQAEVVEVSEISRK